MRLGRWLRYEAANLLCWTRISIGILLAFCLPHNTLSAVLCSLALLTDGWDGWCYRRYTAAQPYPHWYNRLPISLDPIADFVFVAGVIVRVASSRVAGLLSVSCLAIILILWHIIARRSTDYTYKWMMAGLTYFWFGAMLLTMALTWAIDCRDWWFLGVLGTMILLYGFLVATDRLELKK